MTYKAVIFDLDGTLVNSLEDIADATNKALKIYDYPTHSYEAYQDFIGNGIKSLVIKALPEAHREDQQINRTFYSMMEIYKHHFIDKTTPYAGIIELLDTLKSQGLKLGVLSNKEDKFTKRVVKRLLPNYFDSVDGLRIEANKKPNPIKALEISESLGVKPEDVIFVGDTGIDMQTATNANMFAVGVTWGFRNKAELIANGANMVIDHPLELNAVLDKHCLSDALAF